MLILLYPLQPTLLGHSRLPFGPPLTLALSSWRFPLRGLGLRSLQISASGPAWRHTEFTLNQRGLRAEGWLAQAPTLPGGILYAPQRSSLLRGLRRSESLHTSPPRLAPLRSFTPAVWDRFPNNNQHLRPRPILHFRGTLRNRTSFLRMSIWVVAGFCYCKSAAKNISVKP